MRICFLGTSHGVPEPGRQCSCAMLEISGRIYFIDMGMMAIAALMDKGISVDAVQGVFITHMHGDHTNGLPGFVDLLTWHFKSADPTIFLPKEEAVAAITGWVSVNGAGKRDLHYVTVQPGILWDDGFIKVTAIATRHCDRSYAFLVEAEGKQLLFTGDLRNPMVDFPEIAKLIPLDLLVCEASHFSPAQYVPVLQECTIKTVCVTHYTPDYAGAISQLDTDLANTTVCMAYDGMELVL